MSKMQERRAQRAGLHPQWSPAPNDDSVPAPVAALWAMVLSGPILLVVAGVTLVAGVPMGQALLYGLIGQSVFVVTVLAMSARNRTLNAADAARYWGSAAPGILAAGPPHPYMRPFRPSFAARTAPDAETDHKTVENDPHWWVFPARGRNGIAADARPAAACVARPSEQSHILCEWLADLGHDAHHCSDLGAMLGAVQDMPGRWGLVVIDIDHVGSLEDTIDDMIDFREASPGVPVILISASVARDDLSAERLNIADATLRKPVFARSFTGALATVMENNEIWRNRRDALN